MQRLTSRQLAVFDFIRHTISGDGRPPTRGEIAQRFGFRSVNAAEDHLRALARKGFIELLPGTSRGIRLAAGIAPTAGGQTQSQHQWTLPLVGRVAAGSPLLAEEHIEDHYQVEPRLFHPAADYLLRVRGTSMTGAGIMDGDLLAVHRTGEAHNGQIVVARLDEEVTVKRFRHGGARVWLLPENDDFSPIEVDLRTQSLTIEGLSVGVIRNGRKL